MWAAFVAKVSPFLWTYVGKYVARYIVDHVQAWLERRSDSVKQTQKDKDQLKQTRETVKNGSEDDIEKETEKLLNG